MDNTEFERVEVLKKELKFRNQFGFAAEMLKVTLVRGMKKK